MESDTDRSAQEVFNLVARHLLTQNQRAVDAYGKCRYRTKTGLACAVGCLIPEALYDPGIEGCVVPDRSTPHRPIIAGIPDAGWPKLHGILEKLDLLAHLRLLQRLQWVHDREFQPSWPASLRKVALEFQLQPDVIDELRPA